MRGSFLVAPAFAIVLTGFLAPPRSRGEENVASDRADGIRYDNANDPWQRVVGVASVESRRQAVRSQGLGERRRLA